MKKIAVFLILGLMLGVYFVGGVSAENNQSNQKAQYINQIMINGYFDGWKRIPGSEGFFGMGEKDPYWQDPTDQENKFTDAQMISQVLSDKSIESLKNAAMFDSSGVYIGFQSSETYSGTQSFNPMMLQYMMRGNMNNPLMMATMMGNNAFSGEGKNSMLPMIALAMMQYDEEAGTEDNMIKILPMVLSMTEAIEQDTMQAMMAGVSEGRAGASMFEAAGIILLTSMNKDGGINWQNLGLGIAMYALTYKEYEKEIITFTCNSWEAPLGGDYCEQCNDDVLPCDEYQCRSLGQACKLENKNTDEAICYNAFRGDAKPPAIEPWEEILSEGYKYEDTSSGEERSYKIVYEENKDGCAPAFTPLRFGITADEPAKCKIDYLRKKDFEEMDYYLGGSSSFKYNHSELLKIPGPGSFNVSENEGAEIYNDGNWRMYVRCSDPNGNYNIKNLVFEFCVDDGPDVTAPRILTTSLLNGMAVAYEQQSINMDLYTDEVAECRWDFQDKEYEEMENTMDCVGDELEFNTFMMYKCSTTLTGIQDRVENKYYFRCQDKEGNANRESYEFSLIGTEPLLIDSIEPETDEVIKGSSDRIKVTLEAETSAGYNEGEATCYFSETENIEDYQMFYYETGMTNYFHEQNLWLPEGDYTYYIRCLDIGGNVDTASTSFSVESDTIEPSVVRAYFEENYLKLVTNEKAECVYSQDSCNYAYEDGIIMSAVEDTEHFTEWNTNFDYYVKCKDEYENRPIQNQCSIIVRPSSLY